MVGTYPWFISSIILGNKLERQRCEYSAESFETQPNHMKMASPSLNNGKSAVIPSTTADPADIPSSSTNDKTDFHLDPSSHDSAPYPTANEAQANTTPSQSTPVLDQADSSAAGPSNAAASARRSRHNRDSSTQSTPSLLNSLFSSQDDSSSVDEQQQDPLAHSLTWPAPSLSSSGGIPSAGGVTLGTTGHPSSNRPSRTQRAAGVIDPKSTSAARAEQARKVDEQWKKDHPEATDEELQKWKEQRTRRGSVSVKSDLESEKSSAKRYPSEATVDGKLFLVRWSKLRGFAES